jgi:hypothetical protein
MEPDTLTGIFDIEAPAAPLATGEVWLEVTAAVLALAVIAYLVRRWYTSRRARTHRRLAALQRHVAQRQIDSREAAFELATIVRDALGVHRLSGEFKGVDSGIPSRDESLQMRWRDFVAQLTIARYAAPQTSLAQLGELISTARECLRHRP